jgi:hypothetical protein
LHSGKWVGCCEFDVDILDLCIFRSDPMSEPPASLEMVQIVFISPGRYVIDTQLQVAYTDFEEAQVSFRDFQ